MHDPQWTAVDDYIEAHLLAGDPALGAVLAANAAAGLPPMDVSATQGKFLQLIARLVGARRILEIGTLGGYSTLWLAQALPSDGRLVTLELDLRFAEVARANFADAGFADRIELRVGPALASIAQLKAEAAVFDMVFVDADKQSYKAYLEAAIALGRPGTAIVFDNMVREGAILDPGHPDPKVPGTRALFEALASEPRVSATALQTVGAKKWDGFVLAIVNATGN
jgi:predicted O-methyltransferase YrrM